MCCIRGFLYTRLVSGLHGSRCVFGVIELLAMSFGYHLSLRLVILVFAYTILYCNMMIFMINTV